MSKKGSHVYNSHPKDRLETLQSACERVSIAGWLETDVAGFIARDLCAIFLEERTNPIEAQTTDMERK
jgi:hypothetical protein